MRLRRSSRSKVANERIFHGLPQSPLPTKLDESDTVNCSGIFNEMIHPRASSHLRNTCTIAIAGKAIWTEIPCLQISKLQFV